MSVTESQRQAITARGNVLVVAGAGTGKTHTLVERCLACLVDERPRASLDEILMVTFTEAAAAEMRERIRARLEEELAGHPEESHWQEQLALFETAHIGTLHSFCLRLVREHFYQLELDPQLTVMAEEEAQLLANETLEGLFQKHYAGRGTTALAVQQLIQSQGRGWDKPIRKLVLRVHHYTQTLPNPNGWFREQMEMFSQPAPVLWQEWLSQASSDWCDSWQPILNVLASGNDAASRCAPILEQLKHQASRRNTAALLKTLAAFPEECPHGKKTLWLKPLQAFFQEVSFLASLSRTEGQTDPLSEDWGWVRSQMATLLQLAQDFTTEYSEAKHELGMVDFHDLEQHTLRLLWDPQGGQPTPIAAHWRNKLRFIFVDEYQDINAAQDQIIQALSRTGTQANRFLVGDVKQSIYRFRLANPRIFQNYVRDWSRGGGSAIPLVDNFRSRGRLLSFINSFFVELMRPEVGGVPYDENARLKFGAPSTREPLAAAADPSPRVELHLRARSQNDGPEAEEEPNELLAEVRDMEESEKEARLVAIRLRKLHSEKHLIWDEVSNAFRAVEWQDMAILLRSPARKVESYAKEFSRFEVPLQVSRGRFYESSEISDLVSLLRVLDNPLQDIPLLAVLHSPLVGLTLNELAELRLALRKAQFWTALVRWKEVQEKGQRSAAQTGLSAGETNEMEATAPQTYAKVARFLERFAHWRRLARQVSLSRCLEAVLSETHYADWLLTQTRGEQRQANVQRLVSLAEQFDKFQRQGLFRFLLFIEAQQSAGVEPVVPTAAHSNAVRLMSIHQSKGLEFPVVVVADLGKPFNLADLRAEIILDERYGLCPQVKPPHTGKRYPSLPYWLARRRQAQELLGEEMRLLYVAMTRARDTLILSGGVAAGRLKELERQRGKPELSEILAARSYADWIGLWFGHTVGPASAEQTQGETDWVRWYIHEDSKLASLPKDDANGNEADESSGPGKDPELLSLLEQKLSWRYSFLPATMEPAKTSVSELRRRAAEADDQTTRLFSRDTFDFGSSAEGLRLKTRAGSAEIGNAHHSFLELVDLDQTHNQSSLEAEAKRLQRASALTGEEVALLDFEGLAAFWKSELGSRIRQQRQFVRRELAFTARFSPEELARTTGTSNRPELNGEFVVVQGVADLVILLPEEITILDFKTDTLGERELPGRMRLYAPQMKLYALALSRIFQRPVGECWLCFLGCRKQIRVPLEGESEVPG